MLGSNQMEIESILTDPDTSIVMTEAATENIRTEGEIMTPILISESTPIKGNKKRKIEQKAENEDDSQEKSSKKTSINSATSVNSPSTQNGPNFRNEMKKLLSVTDSEITKYYQIKSNNKLILIQGQVGEAPYRYHPDTIKELSLYFQELVTISLQGSELAAYVKSKYSGLIAKLSQDSQVPQAELLGALRSILCPIAGGIPEFPVDANLLDGIVEKVSYGHPEAGNNFSAWSCTFWQVKDLELLGPGIGKHYLTNFVLRNAARMILENSLAAIDQLSSVSVNVPTSTLATDSTVINVDELPINLMKIESGVATPKKREKEKEKKEKAQASSNSAAANVSVTPQQAMPKISSFFAKLKKPENIEKASGEYFQPFFVKPDVTLAPINQLKDLKTTSCTDLPVESEYWNHFRAQCVRIPYQKQTCLCVGYDGKPVRAVLKLLKFEENYRPAYLGTWRKSAPDGSVSARRPFGRVPEIDYEYDSDAEWDEGEDPEGESLSDCDDSEDDEEDEEEEENELEENQSCTGSVDSWLVPHGYLSDDEGVDEVHPGELEDAAREAELMPPPPPKEKKAKRKFIPKEPVLLGPFLLDQAVPQMLQSSCVQFLGGCDWTGLSPFSNYEAVFSGLESSLTSVKKSQVTNIENDKSVFPESLLPSMIQIINANNSAGITKLYDEFILQHGKAVSRRLFESKLNQITIGKVKCPKTGKLRWIFKDEIAVGSGAAKSGTIENYFPSNPDSSFVMQID